MPDHKYVESRAQGRTWIKLIDNGDGTHSVAMNDIASESKLQDIESKLNDINTKLAAIQVILSGTLTVTIG
jgi:hypothetical protein